MFEKSKQKRKEIKFEIVPMIDVMMILVLFLAVMAFLPQIQGAIQTDLPPSGTSDSLSVEDLLVSMNSSGAIYVGEQSVTQNTMLSAIEDELERQPERRVVLAADKTLAYEEVMRVLDTLREANIDNIALATDKIEKSE